MMMAPLHSVHHADGTTYLMFVGRIDPASADEFRRVLFDAADIRPRRTILALRVLVFVDSSGIAVLVAARSVFHRYGLVLRLADPRRQLRGAVTAGGMFDVLTSAKLARVEGRNRPAD
jgi:anti-anti-sigma factor